MTLSSLYLREDTIAALSTPTGRGAIAVIRLSGPDAISLCQQIFQSRLSLLNHPRKMIYGTLIDPVSGELIDDVLCVAFPAPRSYTGEEMVEIHCHGSEAVLRKVLDIVYRSGARPAEPGEFTFRAVRNGKMDLAQAEAVAVLIESRSQLARSLSLRMLEGAFSHDLAELKESLTGVLVELETQLEFPDEAMEEELGHELREKMRVVWQRGNALFQRAVRERRFEEGIKAVLAGRPNVGKSSLFNRLLGRERAIVTPHPGTTRDSLEGTLELKGRPVTLIDTAGLRETQEEIEAIGIQRTQELLASSPIVLFVCDAVAGFTGDDREWLARWHADSLASRLVIIANKVDLSSRARLDAFRVEAGSGFRVVFASATCEEGVRELLAVLENEVLEILPAETDSAYLITARQENILVRLEEHLQNADRLIGERAPLELPSEDLRAALREIAELDGTGVAPDILDTIFSRFCIGK